MTMLAGIGGKGFTACSWVDLTLVRKHPTPHQRQHGSYNEEGDVGTHDGNKTEDGGSNSRRWTA